MATSVARSTSQRVQPTRNTESSSENREHTVKKGETLSSIAERENVALKDLIAGNPQIKDPDKIYPGQVLQLPAKSSGPDQGTPATNAAPEVSGKPADPATVRSGRVRAKQADDNARARLEAKVNNTGTAATADTNAVAPGPLTSRATLRRGSSGPAVRELQTQLNARGAKLDVDGDFGPKTDAALRDFQRRSGIAADGVVGRDTRAAFAATRNPQAANPGDANAVTPTLLRQGMKGPAVERMQQRLNQVAGAGLKVDGDYGPATRRAVSDFQARAGLDPDGTFGPRTEAALKEVEAGTRKLADPGTVASTSPPATGDRSKQVTVSGNTFNVHDMTRSEYGRRSVPGNRIISLDANSATGKREITRPMIVIPNNATPAERRAAQRAVDRVAQWLNKNLPGNRQTTGIVRTTAQNGRGLNGFFHTEFFSVNDDAAVNLIKSRPQEYARILGETLGSIPGANFIVPHGNPGRYGRDGGAQSRDGSINELKLGRIIINQGFKQLGAPGNS